MAMKEAKIEPLEIICGCIMDFEQRIPIVSGKRTYTKPDFDIDVVIKLFFTSAVNRIVKDVNHLISIFIKIIVCKVGVIIINVVYKD